MSVIKLLLKIGGWIFLVIAIIDLTIAFFVYRHGHSFVQSASRAQATITKMVERSGGSHDTVYYPVFTFQDSKGQPQEVYSSSGQYPPAYRVGDTVTVLYLPDKPRDAEIDGFFDIWGFAAILGFMGCVELVVGFGQFGVLFIVLKHERKSQISRAA